MAEREVTVEITTVYIVKFKASSSAETTKKAREFDLYGLEPECRSEIILDVSEVT